MNTILKMGKGMQRTSDFWIGIIILAFCGFASILTLDISSQGTGTTAGPSFMPWLMIVLSTILAVALVARGFKSKEIADASLVFNGAILGKLGLFFGLMLLYAYVFTILGYLVSTIAFFIIAMLALGERRPVHFVVVPVLITVGVYLIFSQLMGVYLPEFSLNS